MTDIQLKQLKDNLWHSADLLRQGAHLAANKFGQPILGLVFLRYADDTDSFNSKTDLLLNHFMDMSVQGYGWIA